MAKNQFNIDANVIIKINLIVLFRITALS
jgi:hypothetical protein